MRSASPVDVLGLWEQGRGLPSLRQAILLLASWLNQPGDEIARLSIGQRDFALLNLRAALFGQEMVGLTVCPTCHANVELRLNADDIASVSSDEPGAVLTVAQDDWEASFRLPTSLDLGELPADADLAANSRRLVERCLLSVCRGEVEVPLQDVSPALVTAIEDRMAEADPLADIQLSVHCPECHHGWEVPFDIISFLWDEVNAWAEQLLTEVHVLASAYGWSEPDILGLSSNRRQFYVRLIRE